MGQELKKLFKNSLISVLVIAIYGLIIQEKSIYIAMVLGGLISNFTLYLLYKDAEYIVHSQNSPMRNTILGYGKRYILFGVFLFLMLKVDFQWFVGAALGLLTVKFNILLIMFSIHLKNIKDKLKTKERG